MWSENGFVKKANLRDLIAATGPVIMLVDESKYIPYWDMILTTSHGTNYVYNDHLYFRQHGPYAIPSDVNHDTAILENQTEISIELSHSWSLRTWLVPKDLGQYDTHAIPSPKMPCYSYPTSLVNQNETHIGSSCHRSIGLFWEKW